jgi:signal transduction histidine kinase
VEVDSVMGKGTTFTVTLPIATAGQPDPNLPEMTKA